MNSFETNHWSKELDVAITVIDTEGTIEEMNSKSCETFAKYGGKDLIGQSVYDCHKESSVHRIKQELLTGKSNHYTITKNGQKKIIHQLPRVRDGKVVGVVEISIPIDENLPHFQR